MDMCIKQLQILAQKISKAGNIISKDNISKDYFIGGGYSDSIIIRSDSGYEAIYIGNLEGKNTDGYMCLYTNNTPKRNSFPDKNVIAELLKKVLKKEKLETGEGKSAYYNWEEFGGMEKQLNYFSEIVSKLAVIQTSSQILDFINTEIPFNELKKNEGIFETNVVNNSDISIGVSYENNENGEDVYIYNVFIESEYINIGSTGNKENKTPISVVDEIRNVLLEI